VPDTWQSLIGELAGARASARIPVSRALLNRTVADALAGRKSPVRAIDLRPRDGDRFDAVVTVTWPLVPPLTVAFTIERQPDFPASPVVVLRWSFLGGVGALASRFLSSFDRLPDGVTLEQDRVLLDVRRLAARSPAAPWLGYVKALELHTLEQRFVIDVELAIPE
jgi:hypothetical protein